MKNTVRIGLPAGLGAVATVAVLLGAGYLDPAPASRPTSVLNRVFNPDLTVNKHAQTPTQLALTTTVQPTTSMAPRPVATSWSGTWTYAGHTYPADLQLFNTDPISGEIHIPGWCDATWSEVQRASETSRLVHAHVISGNCHDNRWSVTVLLPNSITGTDTVDPTTTFEFTPQS